jgi:hypothetical protein
VPEEEVGRHPRFTFHVDKRAITEPLKNLFASLSESINTTNAGLLMPTSDELNEHVPRVRVVDKPMFPKSKT